MHATVIDHNCITVESSGAEQRSHVDNQEVEKPGQPVGVIRTAKNGPMNPTPLYIFLLALSMITTEKLFCLESIRGVHGIQLQQLSARLLFLSVYAYLLVY